VGGHRGVLFIIEMVVLGCCKICIVRYHGRVYIFYYVGIIGSNNDEG
jgi:hypothetical protein